MGRGLLTTLQTFPPKHRPSGLTADPILSSGTKGCSLQADGPLREQAQNSRATVPSQTYPSDKSLTPYSQHTPSLGFLPCQMGLMKPMLSPSPVVVEKPQRVVGKCLETL